MTYAHTVNAKSLYSIFLTGVFVMTAGMTTSLTLTNDAKAQQLDCKSGFVYRQTVPEDFVCVYPASRDDARQDNATAVSRIKPGGGQDGPMTCKSGWVWRIAMGPKDRVCVSEQRRIASSKENELHLDRVRISPNAGKVPNTATNQTPRCKLGFVWRESRPDDFICVSPAVQERVRKENVVAAALYQPGGGNYGAFTCLPGLVWREATGIDDKVCVSGPRRNESYQENQLHSQRVEPELHPFPIPVDPTLDPEYEAPYPEDAASEAGSSGGSGSSGQTCIKVKNIEVCNKF